MKLFISVFILILLLGCGGSDNCPTAQNESRDAVYIAHIFDSAGKETYLSALGYTSIFVVEANQSLYPSGNLPLFHSKNQTTFIFKGDTIPSDTIIFNNYNPRAYFVNEKCGYELTIDQPQIKKSTFKKIDVGNFDTDLKSLSVTIRK